MPLQEAQALFAPYERLGYEVIYASAFSGEGIATIRKRLKGKLSTLAGPSEWVKAACSMRCILVWSLP